MRRSFWIVCVASLQLGSLLIASESDPLESLIESERQQEQKWLEEPHDVPAVYLWGDQNGVEIDNPRAIDNPSALCTDIPYERWVDKPDIRAQPGEIALNFSSAKFRQLVSDACFIRPADRVLVIGEGWQREVALDTFFLRSAPNPCRDQFPYTLIGRYTHPLPAAPLFVTTDLEIGERDNKFAAVAWISVKPASLETTGLRAVVPDLNDYSVQFGSRTESNVDALYFLERRTVTPEDDALPHHLIASCKAGRCATVWLERVDRKRGSGHLAVLGTLDFNGDGRLDLVVEGDKSGCSYRKVFAGDDGGFSPIETPVLACGC